MPPKRYRKERKPIPKTNVAAIIPINRTLIFFLLIELDLLIEIKNPWSVYRPRVSKISLASATRLSKRFARANLLKTTFSFWLKVRNLFGFFLDPWLSVPRLLVVWLYRHYDSVITVLNQIPR